ncbi:mucin-5AC isoform X3 [Drosophila pseudoobscura]|uniref:Mucin-5AC isoform X3 n=1 Tax=Drosophila pseudoobscura pseudoobscura TaxID=46245 RepID=A0A6I8VJF6_DROPS|nr:mucin-5AC isoform X3 [Drosophila pseudoobscura]
MMFAIACFSLVLPALTLSQGYLKEYFPRRQYLHEAKANRQYDYEPCGGRVCASNGYRYTSFANICRLNDYNIRLVFAGYAEFVEVDSIYCHQPPRDVGYYYRPQLSLESPQVGYSPHVPCIPVTRPHIGPHDTAESTRAFSFSGYSLPAFPYWFFNTAMSPTRPVAESKIYSYQAPHTRKRPVTYYYSEPTTEATTTSTTYNPLTTTEASATSTSNDPLRTTQTEASTTTNDPSTITKTTEASTTSITNDPSTTTTPEASTTSTTKFPSTTTNTEVSTTGTTNDLSTTTNGVFTTSTTIGPSTARTTKASTTSVTKDPSTTTTSESSTTSTSNDQSATTITTTNNDNSTTTITETSPTTTTNDLSTTITDFSTASITNDPITKTSTGVSTTSTTNDPSTTTTTEASTTSSSTESNSAVDRVTIQITGSNGRSLRFSLSDLASEGVTCNDVYTLEVTRGSTVLFQFAGCAGADSTFPTTVGSTILSDSTTNPKTKPPSYLFYHTSTRVIQTHNTR